MAKTKSKKKNLAEASQKKRIDQNKKSTNPFEVHINRDKQKVLGRKSKADRGLPGVSRSKAIDKRKRTLLREFKTKDKDNTFLDKRIGEKNVHMSEEEKAMARFTMERMKAHKKKNIFNLNDEEILTHRGQTLAEIEKFDDPKSDDDQSDEENESGKLDKKFVGEAHFGGGVLSKQEGSLSRKELIEQLIAESKKRKAEKQKMREETMDLTEKLDTEWRDLLPIIASSKKSANDPVEKPKVDDYDKAVKELMFEARGMATDRLKSEEEIVKEEKEKLEALEADRLSRMKGFLAEKDNQIRHKSADDLDDGFQVESVEEEEDNVGNEAEKEEEEDKEEEEENEDEEESEGGSENEEEGEDSPQEDVVESSEEKSEVEAEEEEDDDDEDNLSDLKDSDSSSEDECEENGLPEKEPTKNAVLNETEKPVLKEEEVFKKEREKEFREDLSKRKEIMEKAREELPYTFKLPGSYEELEELLKDQNPDYQSIIVERIIKCNHWSLNKDNKEGLSNLFVYLLQHINNCALADEAEDLAKCFQVFDRLCPHLYDLAHGNPQDTKICVQEVIKEKHAEFEKNKKVYPGVDTLIFLKLVSLLFPTSDFRHSVVTPCLVFMSQILLRCRVKTRSDIAKGLFVCTLMLEYTVLSKRFSPAAINFLRGVVYLGTPKHSIQGYKIIPPFKRNQEFSNLLILEGESENTNSKINPLNIWMKANDLIDDQFDDDFRLRAFLTAVKLTQEFKNHLLELDSAYVIFEPILKLLRHCNFDEVSKDVQKYIQDVCEELEALKEKKLEYLVLEKKKPKALRLMEPRIEKVYDGKRHKPMSKQKAERAKLLHKYKKEMKGAVREIRRDTAFLAKVQIKQQLKSDEERKRKVREIFGDAAMQQSELKKLKRKK